MDMTNSQTLQPQASVSVTEMVVWRERSTTRRKKSGSIATWVKSNGECYRVPKTPALFEGGNAMYDFLWRRVEKSQCYHDTISCHHWPLGMRYNRKPKGRKDGMCKVPVQDRLHHLAMQKGRLFSKESFANFSLVKTLNWLTMYTGTDGAAFFFFWICYLLKTFMSCLELSLVFVVHAFGLPSGFVFFSHLDFLKCICTYLIIFVRYTDIPAPSKGCQMVPAIP